MENNTIYIRNKNLVVLKSCGEYVCLFSFPKLKFECRFIGIVTNFFGFLTTFEFNKNASDFKIKILVDDDDIKWIVCKIDNFIYKPYYFLTKSIKKNKINTGICTCFLEKLILKCECFHTIFLKEIISFLKSDCYKWVSDEVVFSMFVKITLVCSPYFYNDLLYFDDFSSKERMMSFSKNYNLFDVFFLVLQNIYEYSNKNSVYIEYHSLCCICMENNTGFSIYSCGHLCCWECSKKIKKCFICKK